ncbi:MAG: glycosyltransferase family 2 protein [Actinobacteria bacterium]|nr:glycosyltransferase family 2 protein [Actinomycetota bacterium]
MKKLAIVPAYNEEGAIGAVVDEIKAFDPTFDVLVVDDASHDQTAATARAHGARVVTLPFNLGIGGAVQTGFRYAAEHGYMLVARIDGDGQHDPAELQPLIAAVRAGTADICVGSRFAGSDGYRSSPSRRIGIRILARTVSALTKQHVTDTTSGFQVLDRKAIELFAADYPHDYPEVEAALMLHKSRLRLVELPVRMRERAAGRSSIRGVRTVYYMAKVMLAILIGALRRRTTPLEDA